MANGNGARAKAASWFLEAAAGLLARKDPIAAIGRAMDSAQKVRALIEDLESAALHLAGLPSRKDVRLVLQRAARLSDRIDALEESVRVLEELAEEEATSSEDGTP
jgi:hypothetical protein